jgi:hypothetical protein
MFGSVGDRLERDSLGLSGYYAFHKARGALALRRTREPRNFKVTPRDFLWRSS